jgi:hypothetical protein
VKNVDGKGGDRLAVRAHQDLQRFAEATSARRGQRIFFGGVIDARLR